jgi:hypothetical protein
MYRSDPQPSTRSSSTCTGQTHPGTEAQVHVQVRLSQVEVQLHVQVSPPAWYRSSSTCTGQATSLVQKLKYMYRSGPQPGTEAEVHVQVRPFLLQKLKCMYTVQVRPSLVQKFNYMCTGQAPSLVQKVK